MPGPLVVRGHLDEELAATLAIGVETVETHEANAMAKPGLTSRAALVRLALERLALERLALEQGWLADGRPLPIDRHAA